MELSNNVQTSLKKKHKNSSTERPLDFGSPYEPDLRMLVNFKIQSMDLGFEREESGSNNCDDHVSFTTQGEEGNRYTPNSIPIKMNSEYETSLRMQ